MRYIGEDEIDFKTGQLYFVSPAYVHEDILSEIYIGAETSDGETYVMPKSIFEPVKQ